MARYVHINPLGGNCGSNNNSASYARGTGDSKGICNMFLVRFHQPNSIPFRV